MDRIAPASITIACGANVMFQMINARMRDGCWRSSSRQHPSGVTCLYRSTTNACTDEDGQNCHVTCILVLCRQNDAH